MDQLIKKPPAPSVAAPTPDDTLRRGRIAVGTVGALGAVVYLWNARDLPVGSLEEPGAAVFPYAVGIGLLATSIAVILESVRGGPCEEDRESADLPTARQLRTAALLFAGVVALAVVLPVVGVFAAAATFIALVARTVGGGGWRRPVVAGIVIAAAIYLLFVLYLRVPLPNGIFE